MAHQLIFYCLAAGTIGCAVGVVTLRNIFHAGLLLIGAFLGVAGLYANLHNFFLAAAQLLIYSGAIAVLLLFGIMMTQKIYKSQAAAHNLFLWFAWLPALGLLGFLLKAYLAMPHAATLRNPENFLREMGVLLLQTYALPFELISLVLLVALLGAVAIAEEKEET